MKGKIFWIMLGIVVIGVIIVVVMKRTSELRPITLTPPELRPPVEKNVIAAVGNSEKEDTIEAFNEALTEIKEKLGGAQANFVIVYSNVKYDNETGLQLVKEQLGTDKIFGSTSSFYNIDSEGYYEAGGLTILAISSDYIQVEIGSAIIKEGQKPQEVAKKLMEETLKEGKKPDLVLVAPTYSGMEEEILEGFEQVLGTKVPILGGTAGDNTVTGEWVAFAGTNVISGGFDKGGVVIAVIYTELKFGYAFSAGFEATGQSGIITKMKGARIIEEIDGRPAQEVYSEWTGVPYEEQTAAWAHLNPLGSKYTDAKGNEQLVVICPFPKEGPDPEHNLMIFHDFEEGKRIWLLKGDWETFLNRTRTIPENALVEGEISKEKVAFGIYIFCTGANLSIPEDKRPEQQVFISTEIGGAPFIGLFAMGEQAHILGIGNVHSNLSTVFLAFSQELK